MGYPPATMDTRLLRHRASTGTWKRIMGPAVGSTILFALCLLCRIGDGSSSLERGLHGGLSRVQSQFQQLSFARPPLHHTSRMAELQGRRHFGTGQQRPSRGPGIAPLKATFEIENDDEIVDEDMEIAAKVMAGEIPAIDDSIQDYDSLEEMVDLNGDDQDEWANAATGDMTVDQALDILSDDASPEGDNSFGDEPELVFSDEIIGTDDSEDFAKVVAGAMSDIKATNISIIYVRRIRSYTSYVVIGSVFSRPQTDAAKKKIYEVAQAPEWDRKRVGDREDEAKSAGWHCVDYGDVIAHIMTPEQREYYDLDSLYSKGDLITVPGLTGLIDDSMML